ncbi:hypothetical protein pEaSNUABM52_00248 [Erwinia phage pEp_SNUABM_52]|nr:hypothetical protein pEaSNUABM52_00248 [Erwinia phage pEp_SNUABM_52]
MSKETYLEVHDAYIANNFLQDIPRSKLTARFTEYLNRVKGVVPSNGIPMAEFLQWANMMPAKDEEIDSRRMLFTVGIVYTHFIWSFTKASYVVERDIWKHLVESDSPKILPSATLKQLPHWSQWIAAPVTVTHKDSKSDTSYIIDSDGFWATYANFNETTHMNLAFVGSISINNDRHIMHMQLIFDITKDMELIDGFDWFMFILGENGSSHIDPSTPEGPVVARILEEFMKPVVNVLLFIASEVDNIYKGGMKRFKPRKQGNSYKVIPVRDVREWRVGTELLNEIRTYENEVETAKSQGRRAHIRRGHYHNYWYGPRTGDRQLKSRWVPPCVVRGTIED